MPLDLTFSPVMADQLWEYSSSSPSLVFYGQYKGSTDKPKIAEAVTQAFGELQKEWPG